MLGDEATLITLPLRAAKVFVLFLLIYAPAEVYAQAVGPDELALWLADPTRKQDAASQLLAMGDKALPDLAKIVGAKATGEQVRREVLSLLPQFGEKGMAILVGATRDPLAEYEAVKALSELDAPAGVEKTMLDAGGHSLNPRVRLVAIDWLAEKGTPETVNSLLLSLLSDPAEKVRSRAAELVAGRMGLTAVPTLMEMLRQAEISRSVQNRGLRTAIIETMGLIGEKNQADASRVVPTLLQALGEEDEQQSATKALVRIGAPSVSALLMILKAGDTNRAAPAMDALLAIGQQAAPEVVSLLQARHPKMKKMARQFLSFYQDPAVFPLLRAMYPKASADDRIAVLGIVALYDAAEPFELIVSATQDDDTRVRAEAVRLLAASGKKAAVPVLLAKAEEDPDMDIRNAAIRGLASMGEPGAAPAFARMLEYEKWQVRLTILSAMAHMATPSDVKTLSDQLRHRKSELAGLAARALANVTYLPGQRSPDEWVSHVKEILEPPQDYQVDVVVKEVQAGDQSFEIAVLGSSGSAVLLLQSGTTLNAAYLSRYLGRLAKDHVVAVIPFPGCDYDKTERPRLSDCMSRYADRTALVKHEVSPSDPVAVVGHSIAGFGAIIYAAAHPSDVGHLVLANPIFPRRHGVDLAFQRTIENLPPRWKKEWEFLDLHSGEYAPKAGNLYRSRVELASQVKGDGKAMLASAGYYGLGWLLDEVYFPEEDTAVETALAGVRVPVLLVFGKQDYVLAENAQEFRALGKINKNLVITSIEGSARFSPIEQPAGFQAAVEKFLQEYSLESRIEGIGGSVSVAAVTVGDTSFASPGASASGPAVVTRTDGELVESSRLTQFLSGREPGAKHEPPPAAKHGPQIGAADEPRPIATNEPRPIATNEPRPIATNEPQPFATDEPRPIATDEPRPVATNEPQPDSENGPADSTVVAAVDHGPYPASAHPDSDEPDGAAVTDAGTEPFGAHDEPTYGVGDSSGWGGQDTVVTDEPDSGAEWTVYLGWGLLGTGALALAAGGGFHYAANDSISRANAMAPTNPDYDTDFDAAYSDATGYMTYAYLAYAVGLVGVLGGLDVMLDWPVALVRKHDAPSLSVGPVSDARDSGLMFVFDLPWK